VRDVLARRVDSGKIPGIVALFSVGTPLAQVGASVPAPVQLMHDFWTTLWQALDS
jgi:hypothetical protein